TTHSIAVTEEGQGCLVPVAQLLHGRTTSATCRAGTAPGTAGTERRAPPRAAPAEILAAAQDRDRILGEIRAHSAGGFFRNASDGAFRSPVVVYRGTGETPAGARRGYSWVFLEVAGRDVVLASGTCQAKATPGGSDIPTARVVEQCPGLMGERGFTDRRERRQRQLGPRGTSYFQGEFLSFRLRRGKLSAARRGLQEARNKAGTWHVSGAPWSLRGYQLGLGALK
ncbi:hypothetical protein Nmel_008152, partial [Mimus melanotis]